MNKRDKKMIEHQIATWLRFNGTWDVTHKKGDRYNGYLYDIEEDFKNFKTRKEADEYAEKLFKKCLRKGSAVELESPESFGKENYEGLWGDTGDILSHIHKRAENGKIVKE